MREVFPIKLLLQLFQATPKKLVAIERFLEGQALPGCQNGASRSLSRQVASSQLPPRADGLKGTSGAAPPGYQRPDQRRFALRRGQGVWELSYGGDHAFFRHRAATDGLTTASTRKAHTKGNRKCKALFTRA